MQFKFWITQCLSLYKFPEKQNNKSKGIICLIPWLFLVTSKTKDRIYNYNRENYLKNV